MCQGLCPDSGPTLLGEWGAGTEDSVLGKVTVGIYFGVSASHQHGDADQAAGLELRAEA